MTAALPRWREIPTDDYQSRNFPDTTIASAHHRAGARPAGSITGHKMEVSGFQSFFRHWRSDVTKSENG